MLLADDPEQFLAQAAVMDQLSRNQIDQLRQVRTTRLRLAQTEAEIADKENAATQAKNDVHTRAAEDRLKFALGTSVRIVRKGEGGSIEISFGSETELNRLYDQLTHGR